MHTTNLRGTTKITKANDTIKKIRWDHKSIQLIQMKAEKGEVDEE